MASEVYVIMGLAAVFAIGFVRIRAAYVKVAGKLNFLDEYRERFVQLANSVSYTVGFGTSGNLDGELYRWLTLNAPRAQREVGRFGVGEFVAPFQVYRVRNYQFIVNTLPKFRDGFIHSQEVTTVDDILVRCIGSYSEVEEELLREMRNPAKWFQHGSRFVVGFPVRLLNWSGLVSDRALGSFTASGLFKAVSGLVALVGFVSAVVGLVTGWGAFRGIVEGLLPHLPW